MKKVILGIAASVAIVASSVAFASPCGDRIASVVCNPASPNHLILLANESCALEYQNSGFVEGLATVGLVEYSFIKDEFGPRCVRTAPGEETICASTTGRSTSVPLHPQPVYTIFRDVVYAADVCPVLELAAKKK